MEEVMVKGKKVMVFEDIEELKWHYHAMICKGEDSIMAEHLMNSIYEHQDDLNYYLKEMNQPFRVKGGKLWL